jgi:hypothetical protein
MFIIGWIGFSVLAAWFASTKRRGGIAWFFLSLIISPLITFIVLAALGIPRGEMKKCLKCAEDVKAEAEICRFCGYEFSPTPPPKAGFTSPPIKQDPKSPDSAVHDLAAAYINKVVSEPARQRLIKSRLKN